MNKSDNTESIVSLDKTEISYSMNKEAKKLMRLPYYKLEELKKQEEKKLKHPNKLKKKEEHNKIEKQHLGKQKKIILKKRDSENIKKVEEKIKELADEPIDKNNKAEVKEEFIHKDIQPGDRLAMLKYSVNDIIDKKSRLSRKQRKLQQAENTLASFMSKEDKEALFHKKNFNNNNKQEYEKLPSKYDNSTDKNDKTLLNSTKEVINVIY
jgi:hypothetical protein